MSAVPAASARPNVATSIAIVGVLFFLIGFFTWLNGPLITFVKLAFELSEVGAFLVLMVGMLGGAMVVGHTVNLYVGLVPGMVVFFVFIAAYLWALKQWGEHR